MGKTWLFLSAFLISITLTVRSVWAGTIGDPEDLKKTICSIQDTVNDYCLKLSGKDLQDVVKCIREKISGVTVSDDLSSFTFSVTTTGGTKTYTVSLALDKMFCGDINNDNLSIVQENGKKVCYADIDKVVGAFSDYLLKVTQQCFNDEIFIKMLDDYVKNKPDLKFWEKHGWKMCSNQGKREKAASKLNDKLSTTLKDCSKRLYCDTADCLEVCCSSYKEGELTKACCASINGTYSESGKKVKCCPECSSGEDCPAMCQIDSVVCNKKTGKCHPRL